MRMKKKIKISYFAQSKKWPRRMPRIKAISSKTITLALEDIGEKEIIMKYPNISLMISSFIFFNIFDIPY